MERSLLTLSIYFKHQVVSPFVVCKGCWKFVRKPSNLPVDITLFPYSIDVVRYEPIVPFYIEFRSIEISQPFCKAETKYGADKSWIEPIRL
jgi:hypothetical protein